MTDNGKIKVKSQKMARTIFSDNLESSEILEQLTGGVDLSVMENMRSQDWKRKKKNIR